MAKYLKYIFLFLCNSLFASKTYTINPKVKNVAIVQNTNFQNSTLKNATYVNGTLDSVYINNGQYCYTTLESPVVSGAEPPTPICTPIDTTKLPLVIRDGEGNQYVVNAGPPPTVTGPTSYLNVSTDNLAANDNLKVQFAAAPNQNFGFDSKQYPAFTEDYECIKLSNGKNYFVANKSVGNGLGQSDRVIATYTINNFNASQLSFKTMGGATLTKTGINNNTQFEITNIPPNADCIYAWYNNQKIGKLNIISLDKTSKKVVLVPVNGASAAGITQQGLNDIYKQANANFTLTTAPNFTFDLGNDGLEAADAKLMSKYSTEMRALREAYKKKDSLYDKNAYYIFIVPSFSDVNLKGYMVRGRALGFVSSAATTTDVAHELAHGAFKLEHTFDAIAKGTSNNLLDYSNNTHLTKSQWLNIQNPTSQLTWFDEEEDGSMISEESLNLLGCNGVNPLNLIDSQQKLTIESTEYSFVSIHNSLKLLKLKLRPYYNNNALSREEMLIMNLPLMLWQSGFRYGAVMMLHWLEGSGQSIKLPYEFFTSVSRLDNADQQNLNKLQDAIWGCYPDEGYFSANPNLTKYLYNISLVTADTAYQRTKRSFKTIPMNTQQVYGDFNGISTQLSSSSSLVKNNFIQSYDVGTAVPNFDEVGIALGRFSQRVYYTGNINKINQNGTIKVVLDVTELASRYYDQYEFKDSGFNHLISQQLGCWKNDLLDPNPSATAIGSEYVCLQNIDFRNLQQKLKNNNADFAIYSDYKLFQSTTNHDIIFIIQN